MKTILTAIITIVLWENRYTVISIVEQVVHSISSIV